MSEKIQVVLLFMLAAVLILAAIGDISNINGKNELYKERMATETYDKFQCQDMIYN